MINESEGDKAKTTTRGLLSVKPKGIIVIIIYKLEYFSVTTLLYIGKTIVVQLSRQKSKTFIMN